MSEETKLERIEREALEKAAQPEEGTKKENTESTEKPEMVFADFGFEEELLDSLQMMRFINPTPIQQQAIPLIQEGRDLIACAQTGTGKTAAFLLPIINKIQKENIQNSNTLIVVPTRELAQQIDRQMEGFAYTMNVTSIAIYGGKNPGAWGNQQRALKQGTQLIIGTPGRLLAHLDFKYANLDAVEHLVLDEADRMLDMGFSEDLVKIIKRLPNRKQTLMFSATMPPKIRTLAKEILTDPGEITIALSQPAEGITQTAYMAYEPQKLPLLRTILKDKKDINIVIFCSSKKSTKLIARQLKKEKFSVAEMHSELAQEDREIAIQKFRANRIRILVATDVMSRGIDINNIGMVINYDVPHDAEDYIHRIGRTARAKSEGEAVTFITDRDAYKFKNIEKLMKRTVEKPALPKELGEGPEYKDGKPSRGGGGRGHSGGGGNNRSGGNKKWGKKKSWSGKKKSDGSGNGGGQSSNNRTSGPKNDNNSGGSGGNQNKTSNSNRNRNNANRNNSNSNNSNNSKNTKI